MKEIGYWYHPIQKWHDVENFHTLRLTNQEWLRERKLQHVLNVLKREARLTTGINEEALRMAAFKCRLVRIRIKEPECWIDFHVCRYACRGTLESVIDFLFDKRQFFRHMRIVNHRYNEFLQIDRWDLRKKLRNGEPLMVNERNRAD